MTSIRTTVTVGLLCLAACSESGRIKPEDRQEYARILSEQLLPELRKSNPDVGLKIVASGTDATTFEVSGAGAAQVSKIMFPPERPLSMLRQFGFKRAIIREPAGAMAMDLLTGSVADLKNCEPGDVVTRGGHLDEELCSVYVAPRRGSAQQRSVWAAQLQKVIDAGAKDDQCDLSRRIGCYTVRVQGAESEELSITAPDRTKWDKPLYFRPGSVRLALEQVYQGRWSLRDENLSRLGFAMLTIQGSQRGFSDPNITSWDIP